MEQRWAQDIYYDGSTMALVLGESFRGEPVKTGHNQGVVILRG